MNKTARRILILGGGFAGACTAKHLERELSAQADVEVLLVSQENFVLASVNNVHDAGSVPGEDTTPQCRS